MNDLIDIIGITYLVGAVIMVLVLAVIGGYAVSLVVRGGLSRQENPTRVAEQRLAEIGRRTQTYLLGEALRRAYAPKTDGGSD